MEYKRWQFWIAWTESSPCLSCKITYLGLDQTNRWRSRRRSRSRLTRARPCCKIYNGLQRCGFPRLSFRVSDQWPTRTHTGWLRPSRPTPTCGHYTSELAASFVALTQPAGPFETLILHIMSRPIPRSTISGSFGMSVAACNLRVTETFASATPCAVHEGDLCVGYMCLPYSVCTVRHICWDGFLCAICFFPYVLYLKHILIILNRRIHQSSLKPQICIVDL